MNKLTEQELLILLLDFVDDLFLNEAFLEFAEKQGYSEKEITISDPR